jgi:uncharacterized protein YbjQ (UPF0145 family)
MKVPMKAAGFAALSVSLSLSAFAVQARDSVHYFPIKDAIEMGRAKGDLGDDVKFFFADQKHPSIDVTITKGIVTNKKTNNVNKKDVAACNVAMLSALIQLQHAARNVGANAVVNIESFYKKESFRSDDNFECHAGSIMAGVALRGDVVRLKR